MAIEGQVQYVQYLQVLVRLTSSYTQTSQSMPTFTTTYGYGSSNFGHFPPTKAGHLSHGLTHLPCYDPSSPQHPVATIRGPILRLKAPTCQVKLLSTQIHLRLPHILSPKLVPQTKVPH